MKYLLDTNVCVAIINGKSPQVEARALKELHAGAALLISSVSTFELWYGVEKSQRKLANTQRLLSFLEEHVTVLAFDQEDARAAGKIRAELELIGRLTSQYDLLIAGQALRHNVTLVTANVREFKRAKNLSWEDWSK